MGPFATESREKASSRTGRSPASVKNTVIGDSLRYKRYNRHLVTAEIGESGSFEVPFTLKSPATWIANNSFIATCSEIDPERFRPGCVELRGERKPISSRSDRRGKGRGRTGARIRSISEACTALARRGKPPAGGFL